MFSIDGFNEEDIKLDLARRGYRVAIKSVTPTIRSRRNFILIPRFLVEGKCSRPTYERLCNNLNWRDIRVEDVRG